MTFFGSVTCWTNSVKHYNDLGAGGRKNARHIAANVRCSLLGYTGVTYRCLSICRSGIGEVLDCLEMRRGDRYCLVLRTYLSTGLGSDLSGSRYAEGDCWPSQARCRVDYRGGVLSASLNSYARKRPRHVKRDTGLCKCPMQKLRDAESLKGMVLR